MNNDSGEGEDMEGGVSEEYKIIIRKAPLLCSSAVNLYDPWLCPRPVLLLELVFTFSKGRWRKGRRLELGGNCSNAGCFSIGLKIMAIIARASPTS